MNKQDGTNGEPLECLVSHELLSLGTYAIWLRNEPCSAGARPCWRGNEAIIDMLNGFAGASGKILLASKMFLLQVDTTAVSLSNGQIHKPKPKWHECW
jgi:hypothetical protein